ncbi:MAG: DUF1510 family protein [Bacillota bacterium]|uniref:DUF1510 family protein n=1 Tax=Virgibacillus salarius TaxID=447199 RepID=A0A941ICB7_9BACI|nr:MULTISPECIES: YrrS family protein [Bacillaceae]NAZ10036.1 DUF1510 family protein [Agaribacter marinus]MBR7797326.1 DUF1510 family protein [Virgibacillus salarius]MCC2250246.1 DUF1510 family protein [Virgibacillus sp. AGTR]MDY7044611.1 DUF1510 family protein [Virgibacillus sp. M23]QRZ17506.1 DUF1510 family protein [Virgibacillus sp. AGTR]
MSEFDRVSRVDKFEKRRKNTKSISLLLVLGAVLLIVLIGFWMFGGDDEAAKEEESKSGNETEQNDTEKDGNDESGDHFTKVEEEDSTNDTDQNNASENDENEASNEEDSENANEDVQIEQLEPSGDNVVEAYTANWEPIGTEQQGPHTTNYDDGSQDRIEISRAVAMATGLAENNMTTHWVGNGGDQKVEATVSNPDNTEIYRVYLSWVDNKGWQPTKVEVLQEVDI